MNYSKYILITGLLTFILQGCISDFIPQNAAQNPNILVVDGTITNGETIIKLSESKSLDDISITINFINDAIVYIETSGGLLSDAATLTDPGNYVISNVILNTDSMYRIRISYDNRTYVSTFASPLITPQIDSLSWRKQATGQPVEIMVHTGDKLNQSHFYRWTFNEIWEYTSPLYANVGFVDGVLVFYDEREGPLDDDLHYNEKYYCWRRGVSNFLILESTARLKDNIIRNKVIHEISPTNNRLSELYYIEVKQHLISKEAYEYFSNLQKNAEEMGSLFAPIPSETRGNMYCLEDDIPVIGFVDVSTNTTAHMYIYRTDRLYERPNSRCELYFEQVPGTLPYFFSEHDGVIIYATNECIDCTLLGGSKDKPSFWPNNHL